MVEYLALIAALEYLIEQKIEDAQIYCDSKLIVEQVNKRWKLKEHKLLGGIAQERLEELGSGVKVIQIPRSKNKEADALVNHILDAYEDK